jgi:hypothetical protein
MDLSKAGKLATLVVLIDHRPRTGMRWAVWKHKAYRNKYSWRKVIFVEGRIFTETEWNADIEIADWE